MRIVDIRETAIPLRSSLANSGFDFSEMTTSVVAVITDVAREGRAVVGFAFNSTGRYACGAPMLARFIPRIISANPESLLDETGRNLDPAKVLVLPTLGGSISLMERGAAAETGVVNWTSDAQYVEQIVRSALAARAARVRTQLRPLD